LRRLLLHVLRDGSFRSREKEEAPHVHAGLDEQLS
jgi:hypothetical protein